MKKLTIKTPNVHVGAEEVPQGVALAAIVAAVIIVLVLVFAGVWAV